MTERIGFPPMVTCYPNIDHLGQNCRISPSVTVMRIGEALSERGIALGDDVMLFDHVRLLVGDLQLSPRTGIQLGHRVIINVGGYISGEGGLFIDNDVLIGAHVRILSAGHAIAHGDAIIARNAITHAPIRIEAGAWLGAGSTVLQGVTIGQGAVVGAGSVVTRDVPPFAVAVGNPAKVIRYREGYRPVWWQQLMGWFR